MELFRETTTTVHTNGRVKQSCREFYDPVEGDVEEEKQTTQSTKTGSIQQKREQYSSATKKEEKSFTNQTFTNRIRSN